MAHLSRRIVRLVSRLWMGHVSDSMDEMWFDMMHATCFDIVNETRYTRCMR